MLAHYFGAHSNGSAKPKPGDFYGHYLPAEEQSDNSMLAAMKAFTEAHNKKLAEAQGKKTNKKR